MRELFNFCPVHEYKENLQKLNMNLKDFANSMELDGAELFVYDDTNMFNYLSGTIGVHLRYWPAWLGFWQGNYQRLQSQFKTEADKFAYYGAIAPSQWLEVIRRNIRQALLLKPEYLVWHVSEADTEEIFTWQFAYSDMQVVTAAAEVFNAVAAEIPEDVTVLFENLWWPGLRLTDKQAAETFFSLLKHKNVGIMLDLGHLANTNCHLRSQRECVTYALECLSKLEDCAGLIKGMHLSKSLSGHYQREMGKKIPDVLDNMTVYKHIAAIDQHQAFTEKTLCRLIEKIAPSYLVHELFYTNLEEMCSLVKLQQMAMGKYHQIGGGWHE